MAGGGEEHIDESQFTGMRKYFNSYTNTGRRNYSILTLSVTGALILYFTKFRKSGNKEEHKK